MPPERLTVEELQAFIEAARDEEGEGGVLLRTLSGTGARVPELLDLRAEDLSLAEGHVTIRNPKSSASRKVPLVEPLLTELRDHIKGRDSRLVFEELEGEGRNAHRVCWLVRQTAKKAGIERRVGVSEIRRTVGHMLAEQGISTERIAGFLGYSSAFQTTPLPW
jgi:integrase